MKLGKATGRAWQTVASFENYHRPLPREFLKSASKALGVSEEEIDAPDQLAEGAPEYQVPKLRLEVFTVPQLQQLWETVSKDLPAAKKGERDKLLESLAAITRELKKKGE